MARLFGTDGVRGVANTTPMTAEMALAIGRVTAHLCKAHLKSNGSRHSIVIGKDTRLSGYMLENALTAGICSMGVDVFLVGPIPTPGIAFITHSMRADAGIVISASHNPYQDNGIKIFTRDGFKLSDEHEHEIEAHIASGNLDTIRPTAEKVGKAHRIEDAIGRYIVFCKNTFPDELTLEGMKLVIDCANGATYKVAPIIFAELGAEVTAIHNQPNGKNINDHCGSQHTQDLSREVRKRKADLGLAFDGDGDRLIAVDERGRELSGDHLLAICARHLKDAGKLKNNLAIITPMSNFGLRKAFQEMKIAWEDAPVGDRNVLELMKRRGAIFGGEQSGHLIFLDHHTTGDGIISALQLLSVMQLTGKKASELAKIVKVAPQRLINVQVRQKPPLEKIRPLQQAIREAEARLADEGRVLVRYSGTELICRVMVEGPTQKLTVQLAELLARKVKSAIG